LEAERPERLEPPGVPDQAAGELSDDDLPGRRKLLEPRRHAHRVPGDQPLLRALAGREHLARLDPDPNGEAIVEAGDRGPDLERGPSSTERVVLVRDGHAERGHDRVPRELL